MKRKLMAAALCVALLLAIPAMGAEAAGDWAGSEYWIDSDYLPVSDYGTGGGNQTAENSRPARERPAVVEETQEAEIPMVEDPEASTEAEPERAAVSEDALLTTLSASTDLVLPPETEIDPASTPIDSSAVLLGGGTSLRQKVYWTGADYRTENYIELSPGAALRPMVASSDRLTATASFLEMAESMESKYGVHVAAGTNGGFYTMANGIPVGVVVRNGALRSDDDGLNAVGFRADGSAIIGIPHIRMMLSDASGSFSLTVSTLNRTRGAGLALFSPDFSAYTSATDYGYNLICVPDGEIPLSGSVSMTVEQLIPADGAVAIPAGRMVVSASGGAWWMDELSAGDRLTLNVSCAPGWENVESAVCLLYPLLEDGELVDGLSANSGVAPRTAVGIRPDGGVVLYTVDGRRSGHSVGSGLDAVARRLRELGCVTAGALDGGASTQLRAVLPGEEELTEINRPSGGTARNVVNYVFLITDAKPTGTAARLALYPLDIDALPGARIPLEVKAADENGYPAEVPENVTYTVTEGLGTVEGGVYIAAGSGSGTITAAAPGLAPVSISVDVFSAPEQIALYGEVYGKQTTSLTLAPEQEVDLTVRAMANHIYLTIEDTGFDWALEPEIGTVDETGHLTAGPATGSGTLTVSAGELSVQIPVNVWSGVPFEDVPVTDARFDAVKYVYDHHLFEGVETNVFAPETVMNRGMLMTVLWRMNGGPEAGDWPEFTDVSREDWYGPAVAWGVERGLITGYGDGTFGPLDKLTKEQILTILWRYAGEPAGDEAVWEPINDAGVENDYAHAPLTWALTPERALFDAEPGNLILPRTAMTRAAVADVLMRYLTIYGG